MSKIIQIPPLIVEVKNENCSVGQIAVSYSFTPEVRKCQSLAGGLGGKAGSTHYKRQKVKDEICVLKLNITLFVLCSIFSIIRAYTFFFASLLSTEQP